MSVIDIELRESTVDDAAEIAACVASVAKERKYLASMAGFTGEETRVFLDKLLKFGGFQLIVVEPVSGRVLGWCDVTRMPFQGMEHVGRLGMGVLAEHRGRGFGRRLLQGAIRGAHDRGIWRIELDVFASNARARHLYEREGFSLEGVKRKARVVDGVEDDILMMARLRAPRDEA